MRAFFWTLALACIAANARADNPKLTPAQIAKDAIPSVVLIRSSTGIGSGFVLKSDGLIATNQHVIVGAKEAVVVLSDGKEISDVSIVAVDEPHDLALIRIPGKNLRALPLADPKSIEPGERVVAIGHPQGLANTVTDGLVSAVRQVSPELTLLQISAPISPGSSGGPLIDETGRVIGVSTLYSLKAQNLNFGVPVDYLMKVIASAGPPVAIGAYAWPAAPQGGLQREVPNHADSLLDDCSVSDLEALVTAINGAIEVGAPLYNDGHHEACFRIYQGAALELQKKMTGCTGGKRALGDGVERASRSKDYTAKAWAMRDAFDGLLDVVARRKAPANDGPRRRDIPNHATSMIKNCSKADVEAVGNAIVSAIDIGAPLYNQGNHEACFRVYEGAILHVVEDKKGCAPLKTALRAGLGVAASEKNYTDKAWALRDAFDGVLDVIDRRLSE